MDVDAFLNELRSAPDYAGQIVHLHEEPARPALCAAPEHPLPPALEEMLLSRGINSLYAHQAQALNLARDRKDMLVVTGTASGKSLCYALPILETLLNDPAATVLLLFPTKALCQDQFRSLNAMMNSSGLSTILAGVYDGDTPASFRRKLRDNGRVILTNPDMLHSALMPQHARWARFIGGLKWLVVDELHVYNGIFGANTANLLRRFDRVAQHHGSNPAIIACSATVGNPDELAHSLFGRNLTLVDRDGSPRGRRITLFWDPPILRGTPWRSRRSANVEAHELAASLIRGGAPTIVFSKAKMTAEMIARYISENLRATAPLLACKITAYRGGYLPEERREIERRLFSGELLGVSTTNALELGIDVGGLDASIIVGYPGTIASFHQQANRAGRQYRDSIAILVGLDTTVNQYVMSHPEFIFGRPVERVVVEPDNPFIFANHLRCAVHELPISDEEAETYGLDASAALGVLQDRGKVAHVKGKWHHASAETPQHEVSLRNYSDANFVIQDAETGQILGEVNKFESMPLLHPEAIYMHRGDTYRVLSLDQKRHLALVRHEETNYYTFPLGGTDVHHIDHCLREKPFGSGRAFWGEVTAYFQTYGYEKINFYTLDAVSKHGVELEPLVLETSALWIVPLEEIMMAATKTGIDPFSGLRGIGYATRMILPLFITCDTASFSHSVGCANSPWNALFIYERYPHGLGFTEKAYERLHEILPAVLDMINRCECENGCPCCVGKPLRQSATWNVERGEGSVPNKHASRFILERLLNAGNNLEMPDSSSLTDSIKDRRQRTEHLLRRYMDRDREPVVFHPIEQVVATMVPEAESNDTLNRADPEVRSQRRSSFDKNIRKRMSEHMPTEVVSDNVQKPSTASEVRSAPQVVKPEVIAPEPEKLVEAGDSVASRARKLKKEKDGG